jgi:hypothetical protein
MVRSPQLRRHLALMLAIVMAVVTLPAGATQAAMVSTEQALTGDPTTGDRARVMAFLTREDVVRQMVALGIDPAEATARAAALSEVELSQIAGELDQLPAGQGAIGVVVGAAVLIFLVLLVTDILGLTDIFPFVRR